MNSTPIPLASEWEKLRGRWAVETEKEMPKLRFKFYIRLIQDVNCRVSGLHTKVQGPSCSAAPHSGKWKFNLNWCRLAWEGVYLPFKLSTLATYSPTHQLTSLRVDQLSAHPSHQLACGEGKMANKWPGIWVLWPQDCPWLRNQRRQPPFASRQNSNIFKNS